MFGDKRLEMPKTGGDCSKIYEAFGFITAHILDDGFFPNAKRLVELNNEVYDRLHSKELAFADTGECPICGCTCDEEGVCHMCNADESKSP
jgi:hypothetical protein